MRGKMKKFCVWLVLFLSLAAVPLLPLCVVAQTIHRKPDIQASVDKAIDELIGMRAYVCKTDNPSLSWDDGPFYTHIKKGDTPTTNNQFVFLFPFKSEISIMSAKLDPNAAKSVDKEDVNGPRVRIYLNVFNASTNATADIYFDVPKKNIYVRGITSERLSKIIFDNDYGNRFRTHWIPKLPIIGMTTLDVLCILGDPQFENTDAVGDDQWVYDHGQVFVYINKNYIVTNVQTSYK
jgi:hypothetical protein